MHGRAVCAVNFQALRSMLSSAMRARPLHSRPLEHIIDAPDACSGAEALGIIVEKGDHALDAGELDHEGGPQLGADLAVLGAPRHFVGTIAALGAQQFQALLASWA